MKLTFVVFKLIVVAVHYQREVVAVLFPALLHGSWLNVIRVY